MAFLVYYKGIHEIYFVAILIGTICVAFYFTYGYKIEINKTQIFNSSWQVYLCLFAICLVSLSQPWYVNLKFPNSLIGLDTWTHMRITSQELDIALSQQPNEYGIHALDISSIGGYFNLMHLYLRSIMSITGLSYKWTSLIFWGSFQAIGTVIFTYLIGKELVSKNTGLLAAFLSSIASWVVFFNEWNIPNSSGAVLCLATAYIILKSYKTKKNWLLWFVLFPLALSVLTHLIAAAWVIGIILCLGILLIERKTASYIILIAAILIIGSWYGISTVLTAAKDVSNIMQTIPSFGQSNLLPEPYMQTIQTIPHAQNELPAQDVSAQDVLNNGSLTELIIDSLGMFLYIGLAVIGILIMLRSTGGNKAWAILCSGTLAIGFILPLLGFSILKERWWYLSEVLVSIPLAIFLLGVLKTKCE